MNATPDEQREILEAAKAIRAKKFEDTYNRKVARLAEISGSNAPLSSTRRYPVVLGDPPWKFHAYETSGKFMGVPEDHYPTMELADICKLPVADLATPDAALFLWTASSTLVEALQVMEAWGFKYTTNVVGVKDRSRLGFWVRNQHETLIIARRGNMPAPPPSQRSISVIQAPRREHSQKPDEAYELIERMYPDLRPGWAAWGNQAPVVEAA
jgi:N6-adenosine-specific RNA methylase IME4